VRCRRDRSRRDGGPRSDRVPRAAPSFAELPFPASIALPMQCWKPREATRPAESAPGGDDFFASPVDSTEPRCANCATLGTGFARVRASPTAHAAPASASRYGIASPSALCRLLLATDKVRK
jgi:hypothetical protein